MPIVVVFSTFPSPEAAADACRALVDERLAACANLIAPVRSIYRWDGKLADETEALAVIKTASETLAAMTARLVELHPYDVPEIVALPAAGGHAPYLAWVRGETVGER